MMNWLRNHFARLEQRPPGRYLLRVPLETAALSLAVALLGQLFGLKERPIPDLGEFVLLALLVAPWLETLLLQMLPITICRRLKATRGVQTIVALVCFAIPHFAVAGLTGITAGLIGGFYFAFTYTAWRRQSVARAFWMTTAHHALYNAILVGIVLVASATALPTDVRGFLERNGRCRGQAREDQQAVWPCRVVIEKFDPATGAFGGTIEWTSLGALHAIEGTLDERQLRFRETSTLRRGKAVLDCVYTFDLAAAAGPVLSGTWQDPHTGRSGPIELDLESDRPSRRLGQ